VDTVTAGRSPADATMRRLLRIPEGRSATTTSAQRAFSTSMVISGTRCLLTYIVLPFVAPALGLAAGVGPALGAVIGLVAIAANVATVRRFWAADHRRRWTFTAISAAVVTLLVALLVADLVALAS
jgi:multisubunit Na+/H+ antiporter MnhB subunit